MATAGMGTTESIDPNKNEIAETLPQTNIHPACQFRPDKAWLNLQLQSDNSVVKPEELGQQLNDPPEPIDDKLLDRVHGSMAGMGIGDALGAHVEFRPRAYLEANPVTDLASGGTWGLDKGEFTDDTSMALCLANSLLARHDHVPYDQLVRYQWWYKHGYMSSKGHCFDIGAATATSLIEFERRQKDFAKQWNIPLDQLDFLSDPSILQKFDVRCGDEDAAGNGALMRLAPVPLFFYRCPKKAIEYAGESGLITHGDPKAGDACRYYAALIVAALRGESKDELTDKQFYEKHKSWFDSKSLHPDITKISEGSYKKNGYEEGIRGKGYVVNALEAALWAFWSTNDFQAGALAAVNLGDDTDTTAAIYGQLAGAHYGYKKIKKEWADQLYAKKYVEQLSKWILYEGKKWAEKEGVEVSPPENNDEKAKVEEDKEEEIIKADEPSINIEIQPDVHPEPLGMDTSEKEENNHLSTPDTVSALSIDDIKVSSDQQSESTAEDDSKWADPIPKPSEEKQSSRSVSFKDEVEKNLKPRRASVFHQTEHLQSDSGQSSNSMRRKSVADFPGVYISDNLKSTGDVEKWIRSFGKDYASDAKKFAEKKIDGYQLLNTINEKELRSFGVSEDHITTILQEIEKLQFSCKKSKPKVPEFKKLMSSMRFE